MYISEIYIENIRCFGGEGITIKFGTPLDPILWTTISGYNSTGKTTLLKCIALGLCDESSAAGLLREADQGYIRDKCKKGKILVKLRDRNNKVSPITFKTIIEKQGTDKTSFENLRRTSKRPPNVLWDNLFVCAYGIGRGTSGAGDISGYSIISAVYNLFNYSEGLQNPDLAITRLPANKRRSVCKSIAKVLNLASENAISLDADGIKLDVPSVGKMALRDLADGYRATFLWLTDFLGWAINRNPRDNIEAIEGIILIDALEEHLHPKWQRMIVSQLHRTFKNVQFISTTHSPLVASGTVDFDDSQIVELALKEENEVEARKINTNKLKGLRADQMLRSEVFDLISTANLGSDSDISNYYEIRSKEKLSLSDKRELKKLESRIERKYEFGDTEFEQDVEKAVLYTLEKMIKTVPSKGHEWEVKRQLKSIFKKNEKN